MDSQIAIELKNVSKKYKIYQDKPVSLKERILYRSKGVFQAKWVLQDVSLTIPRGKMVGLIGRNGSGKSTLLKIMTRILQPDQGELIIRGRVSSLLELGAGFHMDFTGKENVYMNASIFGLSKKEIDSRLEAIINFSELGTYIDNPVRTYSSGMFMRLAFSIAIHVDPEILLIDEILAVGDNAFQKKCISKIEELKHHGKTIVFVSHDNGTMERLCDEVYWIHESKIMKKGNPSEVIRDYIDFLSQSEENRLRLEAERKAETKQDHNDALPETAAVSEEQGAKRWGNGAVIITGSAIINPISDNKFVFNKGQPVKIEISYEKVEENVDTPVFGVGVFKMDGTGCYGTNTHIDKIKVELGKKGKVIYHIDSLNLIQGDYYVNVACHHEDGTPFDYVTNALHFSIHSQEQDQGISYFPHTWSFIRED